MGAQAAYPGDVIGINNPGHFAIGDTIFTGSNKIRFPGIPSFSPECFSYMRNPNPSKYKNYRKGLDQARRWIDGYPIDVAGGSRCRRWSIDVWIDFRAEREIERERDARQAPLAGSSCRVWNWCF